MVNKNNEIGHTSKCGGIPMYPEESLYNELKSSLNENQLNVYKKLAEKFYGNIGIEFPWHNE